MGCERSPNKRITKGCVLAAVACFTFTLAVAGCAPRASAFPPKGADAGGGRVCTETFAKENNADRSDGRPEVGRGCEGASLQDTVERPSEFETASVFYESHDDGARARGAAYRTATGGGGSYGFDYETIESPDITYKGEADELVSFYGVIGGSLNALVSPYIEAGIDLGDVLGYYIQERAGMCDSDEPERDTEEPDSEANDCSQIDMFAAIGITTKQKKYLPFVRWYLKGYWILQEGRTEWVPVTGVSVGWSY